ncbi:MAG: hypothetical protein JW850_09930 [Thermoflexales bacterium]|nr:hypothetical protein [Thermoflexales bacterium]
MDEIKNYSSGSISLGGGAQTEEGAVVRGDKIAIQQAAKGSPDISFTPLLLEAGDLGEDSPEVSRRLVDLRTAIDRDGVFRFDEKAKLAGIVEDLSYDLDSPQPSLERLRDQIKLIKSVVGEGHPPISKATDALWDYVVSSQMR